MSRLSVTDAAFSGFQLIQREWRAVLVWAALRFAVGLLMAGIFIVIAGDDISRAAVGASATPEQLADPVQIFQILRGIEPAVAITWVIGFMLQMVLGAATYRAFLEPGERRFAYLRLGRVELAFAGVTVLLYLVGMVAFMGVVFAVLLIIGTVRSLAPALTGAVAMLEVVGFAALLIWAMVRISLAWADTFDRRSVSLFHSLTITRGHVWRLIAAYGLCLAVILLAMVMAMLAFVIVAAIVALATGESLSTIREVFDTTPAALLVTFSAPLLLWQLFSAVIDVCSYPLMIGPTVQAFRAYKAQGARPAARRPAFHEEDGS
jgi:hypothetical protein